MRLLWRTRPLKSARRDGHCPHDGPGRESHTPEVAHDSGAVVAKLPSIRSCCIADPMVRAGWWEAIERWLKDTERMAGCDIDPGWFEELSVRETVAALVARVPRPTLAEEWDYQRAKTTRQAEIEASLAPLKAAFRAGMKRIG